MRQADPSKLYLSIAKGLSSGQAIRHTPTLTEWNTADYCTNPVRLTSAHLQTGRLKKKPDHGREVVYLVACRRCDGCLSHRRNLWFARALHEMEVCSQSGGTNYFVTLTLKPEVRYAYEVAAEARCERKGIAWVDLDQGRKFIQKARILRRDVGYWIEKVRIDGQESAGRQQRAVIRYLAVSEPHADWEPHSHVLVHWYGEHPVNQYAVPSVFEQKWKHGFVAARAVHDLRKSAGYVAKYTVKNELFPVSASRGYGAPELHLRKRCDENMAAVLSTASERTKATAAERSAERSTEGTSEAATKEPQA